jgi:hypothetical protein
MAFGIRHPVSPMAVLCIRGLLEDEGTSFPRALEMLVDTATLMSGSWLAAAGLR